MLWPTVVPKHSDVCRPPTPPTNGTHADARMKTKSAAARRELNMDKLLLDENLAPSPVTKSYVHGTSNVPLLFETIGERLRTVVARCPDREYLIFKRDNVRLTYAQLLAESERLAAGLAHLGIEKGDRVGIWGPNTPEWVITMFAAALSGYILVNINPSYQSEELRFAIEKVGIKALIMPPGFKKSNYYQSVKDIIPEVVTKAEGRSDLRTHSFPEFRHLIMFDKEDKAYQGAWRYSDVLNMGKPEDYEKLRRAEQVTMPDDPVNIQYTSGTTGQPKGATLTHHNVLNNAYFVGRRAGYHERKTIICIPNPLYHCFGCVMGVLAALVHMQTCVFPAPSFEALAALQAVHEEGCTALYGTPTMFIDMLNHPDYHKYDYSTIRSGFIAGAPCPITLCQRLVTDMNMVDMQVCYGTTETSPVSYMSIRDDPPERRIRSVGHIMDHLESALVDKNGQIVPRGEKGEVIVRGYSVMRCYWNDEEKSRREITADRWYHTGDIGVMHEDGTVSIVGRSKDMIVRGGENIYPTEVEQFLFKHPSVEDVHIVGVPDERYGEVVCAWVRLHEASIGKLTEQDLKDYCKGKIAHFKVPRYVLFKSEKDFPLTVTGKVKKFEIRERSKVELGLQTVVSHFNERPERGQQRLHASVQCPPDVVGRVHRQPHDTTASQTQNSSTTSSSLISGMQRLYSHASDALVHAALAVRAKHAGSLVHDFRQIFDLEVLVQPEPRLQALDERLVRLQNWRD